MQNKITPCLTVSKPFVNLTSKGLSALCWALFLLTTSYRICGILIAFQNMLKKEPFILSGVAELDETFVLDYYKGK